MSKENIYLLYGPPGSGKSTLAKEVSKEKGLEYISVGEITRAEILSGSENGKMLMQCLHDVVEYPADLISDVIKDHLLKLTTVNQSFLFDGFPKYPAETIPFLKMVNEKGLMLPAIFVINIPLEVATERVANRRICLECLSQSTVEVDSAGSCSICGGKLAIRDDDKPEVLKRRYNDFEESIEKMLKILEVTGAGVFNIDGTLPKEKVLQEIINKI